jgi:hypothetical protein
VYGLRANVQAIFFRRLHQPSRPPLAKISPGRPAPAMGPGTPNTAMQSGFAKLAGQGFTPMGPAVPASATKTSPLNGSTVIECALVVAGRLTVWVMVPPKGSSVHSDEIL